MKTTLLFLSVFLTIILFFSCKDEKKEKQQNIDTKEINNSGNSFKNDTLQAIDLKDKLHPCFNEKSELYDEIMSWRNNL